MKPFVPLLATFGLSVALAVAPLAPDAPQALTLPMISADKTFTVDVDGDGRKDRIALYYEDTTMLVKVTTARKKKSSFRTDAGEFNQPAGRAASSKNGDEVDCLGNQGARDGDDGFLDELFEAAQRADAGAGVNGADAAGMAGAPGFKEVESFGPAHLADRDAIRAQAQRRTHQVGEGRHAILGAHRDQIGRGALQFARVFNDHDAVRSLGDFCQQRWSAWFFRSRCRP